MSGTTQEVIVCNYFIQYWGGFSMMFYKDRFLPKEEVHISPDDRGYYFGDGIYEVFRIYHSALYEKEAHLNRLVRSAQEVKIELPYPIEELAKHLETLVQLEGIAEGTLYVQISRGEAPRAHPFPTDAKPVMMARISEVKRPISTIQTGISAITMEDIRWLRCDIKTLNLLPNILAKQAVLEQGVQDVIFHRSGTVTESSASNVMIVQNGALYTHPANNLILHGITRAVVLRLAHGLGLEVREQPFTLEELMRADEAFITSTTVEVTPITQIDGKPINGGQPGSITRKLQVEFEQTFA
jgi:D-alanine transaminase